MESKPISSHDLVKLDAYMTTHMLTPREPKWYEFAWFLRLPSELPSYFKWVILIRDYLRNVLRKKLFRSAGIAWLSPSNPVRTLNDLKSLQKDHALDHIAFNEFVKELCCTCDELARDNHASISHWIQSRKALLEFQAYPHPSGHDKSELALIDNLAIELVQSQNLLWNDGREAEIRLSVLLKSALKAAGQAVLKGLSIEKKFIEGNSPNVNLMLPIKIKNRKASDIFSGVWSNHRNESRSNVVNNIKIGTTLWEPDRKWGKQDTDEKLSYDTALVLVEECIGTPSNIQNPCFHKTGACHRKGIWLPLNDSSQIPGAPDAYENQVGSVVYRNDMPRLDALDNETNEVWEYYINNIIDEPAFFSIPCTVPNPNHLETGSVCIAILNVNITPSKSKENYIYRAYHHEWLNSAKNRAAPFIKIAHLCYLMLMYANPDEYRVNLNLETKEWGEFCYAKPPQSVSDLSANNSEREN